MNRLFSDVQSAIFGFGPIATTNNDPYIIDNLNTLGFTIDYYTVNGVGVHSTWINGLFHGGLLLGWVPSFIALLLALVTLRVILLKRSLRLRYSKNGKIAVMMATPYIIPSFFANIFIDRVGPMVMGVMTIWAIYEWTKWKHDPQNH